MSGYKPGTVALATFDCEKNVRVTRYDHGWARADDPDYSINDDDGDRLEDIRPLVVLDLDEADRHDLIRYLSGDHHMGVYDRNRVIRQIHEQLQPLKPDEPGLWGVVEATFAGIPRRRWVHHEEDRWVCDTGRFVYWHELSDVELVRDGVTS